MSHTKIDRAVIVKLREKYRAELYDNVLPFWIKNSPDREFGGYFNCLDRDGRRYDTTKHVWLQGRQVWMMSRIHNELHRPGENSPYLDMARLGAEFLRRHARDGRCVYFSLTREGKPTHLQRKIFSECFYVMALAEYARASDDDSATAEAREMLSHVIAYAKDPSLLGRPSYAHVPPTSNLAVPMILLNLIQEVNGADGTDYADLAAWCVNRMHLHIRPELSLVLETVGVDGNVIDSPEGRLVNPGHAIEAGWFMLAHARRVRDAAMARTAIKIIDWSYDFGWDEKHGGILYFLDSAGYSPVQLEWSMKLWWPHCEALVAFIMAYQETGDDRYFRKFERLTEYSFSKFSDPEFGEWFGYLDRHGEVNQRFKGGPYKGCFHVPRALFLVEKVLGELLAPNLGMQSLDVIDKSQI